MEATLELLPLETAAAALPAPVKPPELKAVVLAQFDVMRPQMQALAKKYDKVAFELTTPKGLTAAKAARLDLRENGRFMLQRTEASLKTEVKDLLGLASEEIAKLIAIITPVEDPLHAAIQAEEKRQDDLKRERERLEVERKAKLQAAVDMITGYIEKAAGAPAEKIGRAVDALAAMAFPAEQWQEYAAAAAAARDRVVERLRVMHAQAIELEQLRADADAAAEIVRAAAELAPPVAPAPPPVEPPRPVAMVRRMAPSPVLPDPPAPAPAPTAAQAPAAETEATIKLGEVCELFGFTMTREFITATLRVAPLPEGGRAVLFKRSQVAHIKAALLQHIGGVA